MADKNYYWIKLQSDWFKTPAVRLLRTMAGGDTYAIIYLELILLSLENNGYIYFTGIGENFAQEIALVLNEKKVDVEALMAYLISKKLIEYSDDNAFKFADDVTEGLIGKESSSAKRVRAYRNRQKQLALQSNTDVTDRNTELEKELDLELKKDIELKKNSSTAKSSASASPTTPKQKKPKVVKHKYGEYKNVLLSDQQLQKLKNEFPNDWQARIEHLSDYVQSTGKKYKDHLATIRVWAKRDKKEQSRSNQPRKEFGRSGSGRSNGFALENRDAQDSDMPW